MSEDDYDAKHESTATTNSPPSWALKVSGTARRHRYRHRDRTPAQRLTGSEAKIKKNAKRLKLLEAFQKSGIKPDWMIMEVLPAAARSASAGAAGWWPFRDFRPERPVPPRHQP
jgi:DNA-directed RNA polymerase subunit beta'